LFPISSGLDITKVFNACERLNILSIETIESINQKINTFNLEKFMRNWYFDYVLSEAIIQKLNENITGETIKHAITAVVLYKLCAPFRYLLTLGTTKLVINLFKKRGIMPVRPPPGSSLKDLYTEQKLSIRRGIKKQRERSRIFFKRNSFSELNKRRKFK